MNEKQAGEAVLKLMEGRPDAEAQQLVSYLYAQGSLVELDAAADGIRNAAMMHHEAGLFRDGMLRAAQFVKTRADEVRKEIASG